MLTASHDCVLLVWEIRPCLGLLAGDLWPWISFIKKRGRKDDLFFLSPFLSWSPASLPCSLCCSWVIYRIRSEAFIRHIWKHARVTEWTHTDVKTLYTQTHFTIVKESLNKDREGERSKQTQYVQEYLHLYLFNTRTNLIWPQTAFSPRGAPIAALNTLIPARPAKPNQTNSANTPNQFQSGWIRICWCLIICSPLHSAGPVHAARWWKAEQVFLEKRLKHILTAHLLALNIPRAGKGSITLHTHTDVYNVCRYTSDRQQCISQTQIA